MQEDTEYQQFTNIALQCIPVPGAFKTGVEKMKDLWHNPLPYTTALADACNNSCSQPPTYRFVVLLQLRYAQNV